MKRMLAVLPAAAVLFGSVSLVHAGIFTSDPTTTLPSYTYKAQLGDPPVTAQVAVTLPGQPISYTISGTTVGDPELDIIQKLTNNTGFAWGSYTITITPTAGSTLVPGSIVVDPGASAAGYPNLASYLTDPPVVDETNGIVTYSGGVVPTGANALVWISFDVTADPNSGEFGYQVVNAPAPVPEPASLACLAPAALLFLRRRRA